MSSAVGVQVQAGQVGKWEIACGSASKVAVKGVAYDTQLALDQAPDDLIC